MPLAVPNHYAYNTPFGKVTLESDGQGITRLAFGEVALAGACKPNAITNEAAHELQEYFAGARRLFSVPIAPSGTAFQKEVWRALELVPYGQTRTYSQIAEAIGRPNAARAVGGANNANPVPILIPCHRIVPASGGIGGYAYGTKLKRFLLDLEHSHIS